MKAIWLMTLALSQVLLVVNSSIVTTTITIDNMPDLPWRSRFMWANSTAVSVPENQLPTKCVPMTQQFHVSTSETPSAATSSLDSYSQPILDLHNNHRANCSATPLTWSSDMASIAAQIAASCVYAHNTTIDVEKYGQNIGAGAAPSAVPALINNGMYNNEIGFYPLPYGDNNPNMTNFEKWGHYSQIVWNSTNSVGCATQYCPNGLANAGADIPPYFTVCNYHPPGNVPGYYSNVGAPNAGLANIVL